MYHISERCTVFFWRSEPTFAGQVFVPNIHSKPPGLSFSSDFLTLLVSISYSSTSYTHLENGLLYTYMIYVHDYILGAQSM